MRFMILILLLTAIGVSYKRATSQRSYAFIKDRKTIETVYDKKGIVRNIGSTNDPVYIIAFEEQQLNLFPYNLSAEFKSDNKPVKFSGKMKYMYPLEDEFGQYFEVNDIKERHY